MSYVQGVNSATQLMNVFNDMRKLKQSRQIFDAELAEQTRQFNIEQSRLANEYDKTYRLSQSQLALNQQKQNFDEYQYKDSQKKLADLQKALIDKATRPEGKFLGTLADGTHIFTAPNGKYIATLNGEQIRLDAKNDQLAQRMIGKGGTPIVNYLPKATATYLQGNTPTSVAAQPVTSQLSAKLSQLTPVDLPTIESSPLNSVMQPKSEPSSLAGNTINLEPSSAPRPAVSMQEMRHTRSMSELPNRIEKAIDEETKSEPMGVIELENELIAPEQEPVEYPSKFSRHASAVGDHIAESAGLFWDATGGNMIDAYKGVYNYFTRGIRDLKPSDIPQPDTPEFAVMREVSPTYMTRTIEQDAQLRDITDYEKERIKTDATIATLTGSYDSFFNKYAPGNVSQESKKAAMEIERIKAQTVQAYANAKKALSSSGISESDSSKLISSGQSLIYQSVSPLFKDAKNAQSFAVQFSAALADKYPNGIGSIFDSGNGRARLTLSNLAQRAAVVQKNNPEMSAHGVLFTAENSLNLGLPPDSNEVTKIGELYDSIGELSVHLNNRYAQAIKMRLETAQTITDPATLYAYLQETHSAVLQAVGEGQ